jgi:hypothetical protein
MQDPFLALVVGILGIALFVLFLLKRSLDAPSKKIEKWLKAIEAGETIELPTRTDFSHEIKIDASGFTVTDLKAKIPQVYYCEWKSIRKLTAFKRDLLTTDCVCLAFELNTDTFLELNEEMRGWIELCEALPSFLPGTPPWEKWFMEITTPAFEPCVTELYDSNLKPIDS